MNAVDLQELERRATERAAARAGGDGAGGHIVCEGLVRIFKADGVEVVALQGLDLTIDRGELTAIVGASGSGKSTLLNILSGLDVPTAGVARVGDHDVLAMRPAERLRFRRHTVGFVWQQTARNLLPYLTAAENVALPMSLAGRSRSRRSRPPAAEPGPGSARAPRSRRERRQRVADLLELTGVADCAARRPAEMSGGEQQRTAIAVALANDPEVLFADEPTGELDEATSEQVFAALRTVNAELGVTVLVVTHDLAVAHQVRRTIAIRDGRTASEVHRTRTGQDGALLTEEYAVLDRAGRLQLPAEFVAALDLRERVRLNLEPDHVEVRSAAPRPTGNDATAEATDTGTTAEPYAGAEANTAPDVAPDPTRTPATAGDTAAGHRPVGGTILRVSEISHVYTGGSVDVTALDGASFTANRGELVVVRGRSGAGKTTLLNIVGGLMHPTSGQVTLAGYDVSAADERRLLDLRRTTIGYVFQSFGLIPILSAAENVGVPMRLSRVAAAERDRRVAVLLELVGLGDHAAQRPYELSGGQQQRVAIARALAHDPDLLIADEPTGQLDSDTGRAIMELIRALVATRRMTALVATHDPNLIELADRVYTLRDGHLSED